MIKAMMVALALGVSVTAASVASADDAGRHSAPSYDRGGHDRDSEWNRGDRADDPYRDGRGYGSRGRAWVGSEFAGDWRLLSRSGGSRRGGWLGGWGPGRNTPDAMLPDRIRIEPGRRELRVETASGVTLREIDWNRGNGRNGALVVVTAGGYGTTVTEHFTLRSGGRELLVHTRVSDHRKTREMTSVYRRA